MKGGWQGFIVKRKGPNSKKDVTVSGHFETQGGGTYLHGTGEEVRAARGVLRLRACQEGVG